MREVVAEWSSLGSLALSLCNFLLRGLRGWSSHASFAVSLESWRQGEMLLADRNPIVILLRLVSPRQQHSRATSNRASQVRAWRHLTLLSRQSRASSALADCGSERGSLTSVLVPGGGQHNSQLGLHH